VALTQKQLLDLGQQLGHKGGRVLPTESGKRFVMECSCGWRSTTRATWKEAVRAGIHHVESSARRYVDEKRRNGGRVLITNGGPSR
jgi:hypothetical protein